MRHSMHWSRWALLVSFCIACGRSGGELGPGNGTAGRTVASGGSPAAAGGNAGGVAGAASAPADGGSAAGGRGDPTGGASSGGRALGGAAGASENGGTGAADTPTGGAEAEGGAPSDPLERVRVIRGAPGEYWDLTIRGEGLDEYDGKRVLVRIGNPERPPERLGSGDALIDSGGFELVFPAVWESDLYKTKLALIDVDGDRACDLSVDHLFQDSRASAADVLFVSPEGNAGRYGFTESAADQGEYYCNDWFNREWPRE